LNGPFVLMCNLKLFDSLYSIFQFGPLKYPLHTLSYLLLNDHILEIKSIRHGWVLVFNVEFWAIVIVKVWYHVFKIFDVIAGNVKIFVYFGNLIISRGLYECVLDNGVYFVKSIFGYECLVERVEHLDFVFVFRRLRRRWW